MTQYLTLSSIAPFLLRTLSHLPLRQDWPSELAIGSRACVCHSHEGKREYVGVVGAARYPACAENYLVGPDHSSHTKAAFRTRPVQLVVRPGRTLPPLFSNRLQGLNLRNGYAKAAFFHRHKRS
jgi:hypothetical protein